MVRTRSQTQYNATAGCLAGCPLPGANEFTLPGPVAQREFSPGASASVLQVTQASRRALALRSAGAQEVPSFGRGKQARRQVLPPCTAASAAGSREQAEQAAQAAQAAQAVALAVPSGLAATSEAYFATFPDRGTPLSVSAFLGLRAAKYNAFVYGRSPTSAHLVGFCKTCSFAVEGASVSAMTTRLEYHRKKKHGLPRSETRHGAPRRPHATPPAPQCSEPGFSVALPDVLLDAIAHSPLPGGAWPSIPAALAAAPALCHWLWSHEVRALFAFPKLILSFIDKDAAQAGAVAAVRARISRFCSAPAALFAELTDRATDSSGQQPDSTPICRARRLAEAGRAGKAVDAFVQSGALDATDPRFSALAERLHPPADDPILPASAPVSHLQVEASEVLTQLQGLLTKDPSAGPDGLSCSNLAPFLLGAARDEFVDALTVYVNRRAGGSNPLPPNLANLARLIVLEKGDCREAPQWTGRPLGIDSLLSRLTARVLNARAVPVLQDIWSNASHLQAGVGVRDGAAVLVRLTRMLMLQAPADKCLLKLDFSNAFNSIDRSHLFAAVHRHLPWLLPWMTASYGTRSPLIASDNRTYWSSQGVRQGDPLGPALFSLALFQFLDQLPDAPRSLLRPLLWYLDDGSGVVSVRQVGAILDVISQYGPQYGIYVNRAKCEIYAPRGDVLSTHASVPGDLVFRQAGVSLLGIPLAGSAAYVNSSVAAAANELSTKLRALATLDDPHLEWFLLSRSLNVSKIMHILRLVPRQAAQAGCDALDRVMVRHRQRLLGLPSAPSTHKQIYEMWLSLPPAQDGAGVRLTSDVALPAFVACAIRTLPMVVAWATKFTDIGVDLPALLNDEQRVEWAHVPTYERMFPDVHAALLTWRAQHGPDHPISSQRGLCVVRDAKIQEALHGSLPRALQPFFETAKLPGAGAWLTTPPTRTLRLSPLEFHVAAALRFGWRTPFEQPAQAAVRMLCSTTLGKTARHNAIRDLLHKYSRAFDDRVEIEPVLGRTEQGTQRRGDLRVHGVHPSRPSTVVDVTVVSSTRCMLASTLGTTTAQTAANRAEKVKRKGIQHLMLRDEEFVVFTVDALGALSGAAQDFLRRLICRTGHSLGSVGHNAAVCAARRQIAVTTVAHTVRLYAQALTRAPADSSGVISVANCRTLVGQSRKATHELRQFDATRLPKRAKFSGPALGGHPALASSAPATHSRSS